MWRVRPFAGGTWIVCDTSNRLRDWLIENADEDESYEIQMVEMSDDELRMLPEHK